MCMLRLSARMPRISCKGTLVITPEALSTVRGRTGRREKGRSWDTQTSSDSGGRKTDSALL